MSRRRCGEVIAGKVGREVHTVRDFEGGAKEHLVHVQFSIVGCGGIHANIENTSAGLVVYGLGAGNVNDTGHFWFWLFIIFPILCLVMFMRVEARIVAIFVGGLIRFVAEIFINVDKAKVACGGGGAASCAGSRCETARFMNVFGISRAITDAAYRAGGLLLLLLLLLFLLILLV